MRTFILILILAVAASWALVAAPTPVEEPIVDIGEPLVIYAPPAPTPVPHTLPPPIQYAIELNRFKEGLDLSWPPDMTLEEWLIEENKPEPITVQTLRRPPAPQPPEFIETLIVANFPDEAGQIWARRVSFCESGWDANAKNPNSTAAGIFQFLRGTWNWVAPKIGIGTYESGAVYDPTLNVQAAAWLYYNEGPSHWVCK